MRSRRSSIEAEAQRETEREREIERERERERGREGEREVVKENDFKNKTKKDFSLSTFASEALAPLPRVKVCLLSSWPAALSSIGSREEVSFRAIRRGGCGIRAAERSRERQGQLPVAANWLDFDFRSRVAPTSVVCQSFSFPRPAFFSIFFHRLKPRTSGN